MTDRTTRVDDGIPTDRDTIERLFNECDALRREAEEMRAVLRDVAAVVDGHMSEPDPWDCIFCGCYPTQEHDELCPYRRAAALLGQDAGEGA